MQLIVGCLKPCYELLVGLAHEPARALSPSVQFCLTDPTRAIDSEKYFQPLIQADQDLASRIYRNERE